jgi:hypothetical protein
MSGDFAKELGLSKEQQERVQKAMQAMFAQQRAQAGNGAPGLGGGNNFNFNNNQAAAMRNRIENTLASVLTPEQLEKFRALRSQRGARPQTRAGTLWTLEAGKPVAHPVRLGVADDRFTEVVEGDLQPGAKVIVRARTEVSK